MPLLCGTVYNVYGNSETPLIITVPPIRCFVIFIKDILQQTSVYNQEILYHTKALGIFIRLVTL